VCVLSRADECEGGAECAVSVMEKGSDMKL
jgi:hypothetical protein